MSELIRGKMSNGRNVPLDLRGEKRGTTFFNSCSIQCSDCPLIGSEWFLVNKILPRLKL